MEGSVAGLLVCVAVLFLGWRLGSATIIGLFASLPFGSTAIASLPALGDSSPLIYTTFALLVLATTISRPRFIEALYTLFRDQWVPWLVLALLLYVIGSAVILPRLFAGQTVALVPVQGEVVEKLLAPVSGNISQGGYFVLKALLFYAFATSLDDHRSFDLVRRGFMVYATVHVSLGMADFFGKVSGLGDVLAPIRSANYAMHTFSEVGGFWRIVGGYSEASAFAATSVCCLAFVFTYWRSSGSGYALSLVFALLALLVLSTSTTGYLSIAILAIPLFGSLLRSCLEDHLHRSDLAIFGMAFAIMTMLLTLYLWNERLLDPLISMVNSTVFEKSASESWVERGYWNEKSLQAFADTAGLGVGIGSSRSSSLIVSVLSQLGVIGAIMISLLIVYLFYGIRGIDTSRENAEILTVARSTRAAAFGSLLTTTLSGGGADPGLIFFIALAVLVSCRQRFGCNQLARDRMNGWSVAP